MCHRNNSHRRDLLLRLRDMANRYSESIPMALSFCAMLCARAVDCQESPTEVFETYYNRDGYFDHHPVPLYPENGGYTLVKELLGTFSMIPETLYYRIIGTFDRTNLFVEVESFSMMDDLSHPIEGLEDLKKVYEGSVGFSAIPPEHADDFPIPVVVGSAHYPTIARLNHSCDPNIDWRAVRGTNEIEIYALRDIRKGEELFISYIDQSLPRSERQASLHSLYGFTCRCQKCELDD